ncbi:MAG TPA: fused MFS/spermidine synthase [Anaerolineales bacterium]|nr:fused MFS/spermidine synthase [Anaerolineales bacterium]
MNKYLSFTVFISGLVTLAVELTAARLLGAVFGTSNLVWASVIGLILIYLSAGYYIGGRWADRSPHPQTLFTILAWAAFTAGLVPLLAKPVLPLAAAAFDRLQVGVLAGSFLGVLILFSVPITLMGMVSPFVIRLLVTTPEGAGAVAGRVYALSTIGSFAGTFLPVLVTVPLIGTTLTFVLFSLVLTAVAAGGLWLSIGWRAALRFAWMPVAVIAATWLWGDTPFKRTAGQIYETESAYNYIEVLERDGYTLLRLNEGQGIHSVYHPVELNYHGPWEQFLVAPFFNPDFEPDEVERIGIVGLAGGTLARQATAVFGPVPIDGWEIDPEIIAVGREYFGMDLPNLDAIARDGRVGLAASPYRYTVIAVDAYRPPYIPWHLTTVEFFQLVHDRLADDGVMVINIGRAPDDRRLIDGLARTAAEIFPSLYVYDVEGSFNSILAATRVETEVDDLYRNFSRLVESGTAHPLLLDAMAAAISNLQPVTPGGIVFTDDRAPIEWLTNYLVLNYLLHSGTEGLQ